MKNSIHYITIWLTGVLCAAGLITAAQNPVRKVLLEEYTTASCGNCPMMSAHINNWHMANAGSTILVAIHQGSGNDAMSNSTTAAIFNAMHPAASWFAPAIMIDRGVYPWIDTEPYLSCYLAWGSGPNPGIDTIATRLMNEPAKVSVDISGTYNSSSRTINATIQAKFTDSLPSGDWRLNLFLIEDSVVGYPGFGPFAGWDQHCYDANWANANYPGMFDGTSIIGYPHRHVMRTALLGNWGAQGIIPAVPAIGVTYSTSASLVIDTAYRDNHLSLVAFVSAYGAGKNERFIINANEVELTPFYSTGMADASSGLEPKRSSLENIYPSPAKDQTTIRFYQAKSGSNKITLNSIYGHVAGVLNAKFTMAGYHEISVNALKYAKGIYYVMMETADGLDVKKIVID